MPRPDEHEMFVCAASLSIQGGICGFENLQYQNILNNNDIQLSHETCKEPHTKPWAAVKINKIPLSTMGTNGLFTHVQLAHYKMGGNLFTRQVGSVDNEGYCTGQGMTYHGLQYYRKKATVTIRIKLSRRKLTLGEHESRGFKCSLLEHHCTYPGGVMYWESKDCPSVAIYMFSDGFVFRTHTEGDQRRRVPTSPIREGGLRRIG